jgi:pseudouridine-5'-phosphate glycosidase
VTLQLMLELKLRLFGLSCALGTNVLVSGWVETSAWDGPERSATRMERKGSKNPIGPVVALESTVIAHGLPRPLGLQTAIACEDSVRETGARPATIAIVRGDVTIGLSREELAELASRDDCRKVNLANLAETVATGSWGATTVAATLHLALQAGIEVFATGGIGGAHKDVQETFDISADITALGRYRAVVVCAGAKAILDLQKTMELLETLGVPVIGYQTSELPAFYSRSSGIPLDLQADNVAEVARIARTHWDLGFRTAVLVGVPVPKEAEIPRAEIEPLIERALDEARAEMIQGKDVTPFVLRRISELSQDRSLAANIALLKQNARIAGEIACTLYRLQPETSA